MQRCPLGALTLDFSSWYSTGCESHANCVLLLTVLDAAHCNKTGLINWDLLSFWPRIECTVQAGHSSVLSVRLTPHLHIISPWLQFPWWLVRPVCELWAAIFSWRAIHPPCCFTHHAVEWEAVAAQSTLIHWKGTNKAVTVMYVAAMCFRAVAPVAACVSPLEGVH